MITVHSVHNDEVIEGRYLVCESTYQLAIDVLVGLINKLDIQRKLQKSKLYERLGRDLLKGCIMPPLTLAFLAPEREDEGSIEFFENFITKQIGSAFVLDGIQRLNTLQRIYFESREELNLNKPLFLNVIVCDSKDKLLYRMITLNNGQKPMSARHQIEILAENFLTSPDVPIAIQTEKESSKSKVANAYKKADIVKGYIAYITGLLNYDNQKIIEEKMDELIAERILEYNVVADSPEFMSVLEIVRDLSQQPAIYEWFNVNNNFIGFSVGIRKSFNDVARTSPEEFAAAVRNFEGAFSSLDVSKIKLGRERRKLAEHFVENYAETKDYTSSDFAYDFMDLLT